MRPVCKADNLTSILCRCHEIWEPAQVLLDVVGSGCGTMRCKV